MSNRILRVIWLLNLFFVSHCFFLSKNAHCREIVNLEVKYQANDVYYDRLPGNRGWPELFLRVVWGEKVLYESKVKKDSPTLHTFVELEAQKYATLDIQIWDKDVKSDDLLMTYPFTINSFEPFEIQTKESNVPNSLGGTLTIKVRSVSSLEESKDTAKLKTTFSKLSRSVELTNVDSYPISSNGLVQFHIGKACVTELEPVYRELYKEKLNYFLATFPELLTFHIYDQKRGGFIGWLNGWLSGYVQVGKKISDWWNGDTHYLEDLIEKKYRDLAFDPTMKAYNYGIQMIGVELLNDYSSKCGALVISEMDRLTQLYQMDDITFKFKEAGLVESSIMVLRDSLETFQKARDGISDGKKVVKGGKALLQVGKNLAKGGLKATSLKKLTKGLNVSSKTSTQGASRSVGTVVGLHIGAAVQSKALAALASKGMLGKTSVLFFKASSSKLVTKIGLSGIAKGIATKAASAAGGKALLLVAERSIGVAVSTVSMGIGVIFDYAIAKGIALATNDSLKADFIKQNDVIKTDLINSYTLNFSEQITEVGKMILEETTMQLTTGE